MRAHCVVDGSFVPHLVLAVGPDGNGGDANRQVIRSPHPQFSLQRLANRFAAFEDGEAFPAWLLPVQDYKTGVRSEARFAAAVELETVQIATAELEDDLAEIGGRP